MQRRAERVVSCSYSSVLRATSCTVAFSHLVESEISIASSRVFLCQITGLSLKGFCRSNADLCLRKLPLFLNRRDARISKKSYSIDLFKQFVVFAVVRLISCDARLSNKPVYYVSVSISIALR